MFSNFSKLAMAAAAALCLPAAAQAGTATTTSTASFNVITQCSITGATLQLGTFTTNQTWGDVAAQIGLIGNGMAYTPGSAGESFLTDMGSVTCNTNTPYTFNIQGTSTDVDSYGAIKFSLLPGKTAKLLLYVNRLGLTTLPDASAGMPGQGSSSRLDGSGWDRHGHCAKACGQRVALHGWDQWHGRADRPADHGWFAY